MTKRKLSETFLFLLSLLFTFHFLLAFPNSYIVEAGFCHIDALVTKQRNSLDVGEHVSQRLKLTNLSQIFMNLSKGISFTHHIMELHYITLITLGNVLP